MSDVQIAVIDQQDTQIVLAVPGVQGATGSSIPSGGTVDQVLRKNSSTNYDAGWTQVTSAMIANGTIVNEDVNNSAAIAGTKISPDFGGQAVTTTGQVNAGRLNVTSNTIPSNGVYLPSANSVAISTNGTGRLFVDSSGRLLLGTQTEGEATGDDLTIATTGSTGITIRSGTANYGNIYFSDGTTGNDEFRGSIQYNHASDFLTIGTNAGERLRITSDGKLGLGTSSPSSLLELSEDQGTTITLRRNNSAAVADDLIGKINFFNNDGSSPGARVTATVGAYAQATAGGTYLAFSTATNGGSNAERLRIDSSGNVGVGTTSPYQELTLRGTNEQLLFDLNTATNGQYASIAWNGSTSDNGTGNYSAEIRGYREASGAYGALAFHTRGSSGTSDERMRIDSSGRLLLGTSNAYSSVVNNGAVTPTKQLAGTGNSDTATLATNWANNSSGAPSIQLAKSRGGSKGTHAPVISGDRLGTYSFAASDGTNFVEAASIEAQVDGTPAGPTPGPVSMPGRLVFSTTADGASSPTERMRITSTGQVRLAGAGITFNGDTAAANELDDYEEGTFTPTIVGLSTTGTGTYTNQTGRYTKIGNRVFIHVYLSWTAHTGTGNMRIAGIPFTSASGTSIDTPLAVLVSDITLTANSIMQCYVINNSTNIAINQVIPAGGATGSVGLDTAGLIVVSGHYFV